MKLIIRYFTAVLPALFATLIAYILVGFVELNWNFYTWTKGERIGLLVFNLFMWAFSYMMLGFRSFLDDKGKK